MSETRGVSSIPHQTHVFPMDCSRVWLTAFDPLNHSWVRWCHHCPKKSLVYFFLAGSELAREEGGRGREKEGGRQEWKTLEQTRVGKGGGRVGRRVQRVVLEKGSLATPLSCVQGCTLGILFLYLLSNGGYLFPNSSPLRTSFGFLHVARESSRSSPSALPHFSKYFSNRSWCQYSAYGWWGG